MQKTLTYFFVILCHCVVLPSFAQSYKETGQKKVDSLKLVIANAEDTAKIRMLNMLAQQYIDLGIFNTADSSAREALKLSDKLKFKKFKADSYNKIGLIYTNTFQYQEARDYFFKALTEDRRIFNQPCYIKRLGNIGITYVIERNFEMAMHYYQISLSMAQLYGDSTLIAFCYNNIGGLLTEREDRLSAFTYFSKALEMNKAPQDKSSLYISLKSIARIYERWGDGNQAEDYCLKALKVAESIGSKSKIELCFASLGLIYKNRGNFSQALEYYFQALKMAEELNYTSEAATLLSSIGGAYFDSGDKEHSLEYILKGYELIKKTNDVAAIASQMGNVGLVYSEKGDRDKALSYYLKSIELTKKLGIRNTIQASLNNVAFLYVDKAGTFKDKDSSKYYYAKALDYLNQSLENAETLNLKEEIVYTNSLFGLFYKKQNELDKAEMYYKKALQLSRIIGEIQYRKTIYEELSNLYGLQKKFNLQLQYYKEYITMRDSIYNTENSEKKLRSEINFEFEKKQSIEKTKQEQQNMLALAEKKRQKTILWFLMSFCLLILVTAAFVYRSYLLKQRVNTELQIKNQRIEVAHKIIAEKNHEITDSINYALHIQQAILPDTDEISNELPNSFVLYVPKDIVSGDFYFFVKEHNKLYIAAADCTGHGVPGGFMTMLGSEKLRNAIKQNSDPGKILSILNDGIKSSLHQSEHAYTNRNGMDIALCVIDMDQYTIEFAGANRPIWIVRKNSDTLEEIAGTKASIGGITENDKYFSTHIIQVEKGDTCYIFSDGYADQFGVNDKKITTKRFKNLIMENSCKSSQEQEKILQDFLHQWKGNTDQTDDILVIGITI